MFVSDRIAKFLKEKEIEKVFIYPGGTVAPLINSLLKENIEIVCLKNEQGAGYAAIGAAKCEIKPQVVIVTSGPGVTNLITPIADAYFDSVPLIVFTGQVGTKDINITEKVRQTGFQEIKTTKITSPITKYSEIASIYNIDNILETSFQTSTKGRPGPVLIDLPMDVQKAEYLENEKEENIIAGSRFQKSITENVLKKLVEAKRPLVLAGNGVYLSKTSNQLRYFLEKYNIPVITSLPGIGVVPTDFSNHFGFIGHTGEYYANLALNYCDFLLVLGARLDVRQTGSEIEYFKKNKVIVRVDIDSHELSDGRVMGNVNLNCNLTDFFKFSNQYEIKVKNNLSWFNQLKEYKEKFNSKQFYNNLQPLSMFNIVNKVDELTKNKKVIVTTGVGTHQHIAARYFTYNYPERMFFTSAGHGAMGYDIPTVIGAVMEKKDYLGIVFVGDGSFQMNIQELATIKQFNLPIKIFVFDNKRLGLVSQFQKLNWNTDPTTGDKINPDFAEISKAYGLKSLTLNNFKTMDNVLNECFKDSSPTVVNCIVSEEEDILPMLLGGQKLNEMYPFKGEV